MNRPSSVTCSHIFVSFVSHISIWHKASWGLCGLFCSTWYKCSFDFLLFSQPEVSLLRSSGFIFLFLWLLILFCTCFSTRSTSTLCLQPLPFPVRQQQQFKDVCVHLPHPSDWGPFLIHLCTHTHTHSASEGSGKVRYSDEVCSKNTSCFPGKAASEKVAVCSLTT